jgi:hypothetical protein
MLEILLGFLKAPLFSCVYFVLSTSIRTNHLKCARCFRTMEVERSAERMKKRKMQQPSEQDMTVYAVHEPGHAVVGHVIGRLIEEVSIVPSRKFG